MSNRSIELTESLYEYLLSVSLREPEVLAQLRKYTANMPNAKMQIAPEQGQFMALLVKLIDARRALEIGVFTGYSSLAVALALPTDGQLIACDVNKEWTDVAYEFWQKAGVANKIILQLAPAVETLEKLLQQEGDNSFDFVFIDAKKTEYWQYYQKALSLLRPGGLMIIDNVLQNGRVIDETCQDEVTMAIREFNQKIFQDQRVEISLIPVADGLTLIRKKT